MGRTKATQKRGQGANWYHMRRRKCGTCAKPGKMAAIAADGMSSFATCFDCYKKDAETEFRCASCRKAVKGFKQGCSMPVARGSKCLVVMCLDCAAAYTELGY